jgi:site-specific DNA recombinase
MIGIYCRTSKARKEKYTIEVQKKGIQFAKSPGLPYKIYVDDGISGTLDESSRDGIAELFDDMRSK